MAYNENGLTKLAALQDLAEQIAADYATKAALEQVSNRVEEIATIGGEPNVITAVKNNGEALPIADKAVDIGASISAAVAAADHLQRKKVASVDDIDPAAQGADRFIYMVPKAGGKNGDKFDEYMILSTVVHDHRRRGGACRRLGRGPERLPAQGGGQGTLLQRLHQRGEGQAGRADGGHRRRGGRNAGRGVRPEAGVRKREGPAGPSRVRR